MKSISFPTIGSIATKNVVTIDNNSSINSAVEKMISNNIRDIVVHDGISGTFSILTVNCLVEFKLKKVDFNNSLSSMDLCPLANIDKNLSLLDVMNHIDNFQEYSSVIDDGKIYGIVSYSDIVANVDPKILINTRKLGDIVKESVGKSVDKKDKTIEAIKHITDSASNAIIILDNNIPVGIFTTKDFLNLVNSDKDLTLPIENYMVAPVQSMADNKTLGEALEFLKKTKFKRVVVTDKDSKFVGFISQKELIRVGYNKWIDYIEEKEDLLLKFNEELEARNSRLEKAAHFDFLTRLYNRSKFTEFLTYEIKKIKRYDSGGFSVVLLDIDHFKEINDRYGHLVGDKVLKSLSDILKENLRESDIVSRWGGEEFILLLPITDLDSASIIAEKLRKNIESHFFSKDKMKITCSLGVAQYKEGETEESLFKRADEALYRAKEDGRNRVELEEV